MISAGVAFLLHWEDDDEYCVTGLGLGDAGRGRFFSQFGRTSGH